VRKHSFIKKNYQFNNYIKEIFSLFGIKSIIVFIIYLIGIISGLIIIFQLGGDITSDFILDKDFLLFLQRETIYTSLFFKYLVTYILLISYSVFLNRNLFWNILNFCIVFCLGFKLGYDLGIYTNIFNIFAIIISFFVIIIIDLIVNYLYSLIIAIVWIKNKEIKKYGKCCINSSIINSNKLLICITVSIVLLLFIKSFCCNLFLMFVVL